jgi:hypothetical protein
MGKTSWRNDVEQNRYKEYRVCALMTFFRDTKEAGLICGQEKSVLQSEN